MGSQKLCMNCLGKGKVKVPLDNDKYSEAYDRLDNSGMAPEIIRDRAMEETGYQWVNCPKCSTK